MGIAAVMIDNREPEWIKNLKFGCNSVSGALLEAGDIWVVTDDQKILVIERKTPNDFLGTLKAERLFVQAENLQEMRRRGMWPYIVITGELQRGATGQVFTDRETGWSWNAIQGALLTLQEMGIFVHFCGGDADFEAAVIRLAERSRDEKLIIPPAREGRVLGMQAGFLCGLPGIGPEKVSAILDHAGSPAWALVALTNKDSQLPGIGAGLKNNIRWTLGLKPDEQIGVVTTTSHGETLEILRYGEQ